MFLVVFQSGRGRASSFEHSSGSSFSILRSVE